MGCYINPVNQSKESFLKHNGVPIDPSIYDWSDNENLPVCLVDNVMFTAAAVCYNKKEMSHFTMPGDHRQKLWFKVNLELLLKTCPDLKAYLFKE